MSRASVRMSSMRTARQNEDRQMSPSLSADGASHEQEICTPPSRLRAVRAPVPPAGEGPTLRDSFGLGAVAWGATGAHLLRPPLEASR
eukprot:6196026-Pleurochrysis_carterae.AAC.1